METSNGSPAVAPGTTLRIATWNLQSCSRGMAGIAAQLRAVDADVVALQEVDRGTRRSGRVDQAARLASAVGYPHHQFFAATDWDVGEYGLALLSRHPLTQPRITRLPILPGIEPRILASAVVALPCGPLSVHVTHLSHRPSEAGLRARQVAHIRDVLARDPLPRVLAGDFNDLPGSDAHRGVTAALVDLFDAAGEGAPGTFPLPVPFLPPLRIDYVFASAEIRPRRTHVVETAASDHHLLLAHVEYRGAREQAAGEAA